MYGYGNSFFLTTRAILAESNAAVLPVNTVAPALSGTAQEGQTLTCSTGTWSGTPTITYSYQWKRNGSNIGSATNSTYTLVTADVGQSILCTVTATNGAGSVNADSNTVTPTSAVDPDAQAFITAAAITNPTQQAAINTLVVSLKGYNIWSKMKAIYPFVGGTSSTHKWNLKDPRDLDAAFRLVFINGWTHSSNGALPNGTDGYADTKLDSYFGPTGSPLPYISENDISFGVYSRTNNVVAGADISGGRMNGSFIEQTLITKFTDNNTYWAVSDYILNGNSNIISDTRGLINVSRLTSATKKIYRNGSLISTGSFSSTPYQGVAQTFLLSKRWSNTAYSNRQLAFAYISNGLTDTEAANLYTAVQTFQTSLGRQV